MTNKKAILTELNTRISRKKDALKKIDEGLEQIADGLADQDRSAPVKGSEPEERPGEVADFRLRYLTGAVLLAETDGLHKTQILRTGTFHHPHYGKFTITEEMLDAMAGNFGTVRPKFPTELVVDYEHLSASDISEPTQGKAAGWIKSLLREPGALFALVAWTPEALEAIRKEEFRFISPEFSLNYTDPETGKKVGPTLLASALTNRPFLEGMQPVVLSESLGAMLFAEEELTDEAAALRLAEWDTAYINDLPDSAFAYVESGGEKDEDGKTVPRALRHLPFRNAQGETDLPHLRNALSRLPQTALSPAEKAKARAVLHAAAEKAGVGEAGEQKQKQKEARPMEKELRELLELGEEADVLEAVGTLKARAEETETLQAQVTKLTGEKKAAEDKAADTDKKLKEAGRDKLVEDALSSGKITPKMRGWADAYALNDPEGFKSFFESAEKVGPDLTVKGKDGDKEGDDAIQLSEAEKGIAKKMGLSEEDLIEQKKADEAEKKEGG